MRNEYRQWLADNRDDIEADAINNTTPEDIFFESEYPEPKDEGLSPENAALLRLVENTGLLDETDVEVLTDVISRQEAADRLDIEYDTYKKRLQRKLKRIREEISFEK